MTAIAVLTDERDALGESPVWDERAGRLYWVDIRAPSIRWLDGDGRRGTLPCPAVVGCVGLAAGTGLVAALQTGFHRVGLAEGRFEPIADPERDVPGNRFNDGRVDRDGNFWASTMNDAARRPDGSLYRLAADGGVTRRFTGWDILNATAFSLDGTILYQADTFRDRLWAFPHDRSDGRLGEPRLLLDTSSFGGHPDGATVDAAGALWVALQGAGRLLRITPAGMVDRIVELPVTQPTSCTFGGAGFEMLFVTTAAQRLSDEALAAQPMAGCILALSGCGSGIAESRWVGA
ncbi:SMP-30/gluconolactonase/LRE family protein [Sphingomonas sp.]|uniref:SMP-30/gluconolactonase/LRE family protein n=1 Tax=Sphingomonas sp. TaxID=28214 RepID=UPI000DB4B19A|nr:SMP-30/gluconolactonase/LRE family protein [Sphingomonas sp.]PZU06499.1 MAG: transcriptional regulator [Sphingomonas sp.]